MTAIIKGDIVIRNYLIEHNLKVFKENLWQLLRKK